MLINSTSFVDYKLNRKIRAKESLTPNELDRVLHCYNKLNTLLAVIGEYCVEESKEHCNSEDAVEGIRRYIVEHF